MGSSASHKEWNSYEFLTHFRFYFCVLSNNLRRREILCGYLPSFKLVFLWRLKKRKRKFMRSTSFSYFNSFFEQAEGKRKFMRRKPHQILFLFISWGFSEGWERREVLWVLNPLSSAHKIRKSFVSWRFPHITPHYNFSSCINLHFGDFLRTLKRKEVFTVHKPSFFLFKLRRKSHQTHFCSYVGVLQ